MLAGDAHIIDLHDPLHDAELEEGGGGNVIAPMPGKLTNIMVKAGDKVSKGDPLAILEAMKMENTLIAPADGVVSEVSFSMGDQVDEGAVVVSFEAAT